MVRVPTSIRCCAVVALLWAQLLRCQDKTWVFSYLSVQRGDAERQRLTRAFYHRSALIQINR